MRAIVGIVALLALLALLASPASARAQDPPPLDTEEETRLLREASGLERQGRPNEAIRVLEGLLDRKPGSSGGLFALERALRSAGRIEAILPRVDAYLEVEPAAAAQRQIKLRVLVEIDSLGALPASAEAWLTADPESPDAFREVARLYQRAFGPERALEMLRRGRAAVGDDEGLVLETGDVLAVMDRFDEAGAEWARVVADPRAGVAGVLRRLDGLTAPRPAAAQPVIDALLGAPPQPDRRLAAVAIALRHLDPERARGVASSALEGLGPGAARQLLDRTADAARDAGVPSVSVWALEEMRSGSQGLVVPASLEERLASAALAAGDTATALAAQGRLAAVLPPGSPERRRAVAHLIRIEAGRADAATLRTRLGDFRREFPEAPETDDLAAAVAAGLSARGLADAALEVTDQVGGPRSLLERAWLLFAEGDLVAGREALEAALPSLAPSRATEVVQLLARLERVGPAAGRALASAAALEHAGRTEEGIARLEAALDSVPAVERSPLRHQAAELAFGVGDGPRGRAHLRALLEESPEGSEVPEAMLGLARSLVASGEVGEARSLLEALILERPQAAVVPAARRELQKIGRGG